MKRICLHIQGLVQGVGFRPFVYTLALEFNLSGFIANSTKGVHVEIQGEQKSLDGFIKKLQTSLPPLARIDKFDLTYKKLENETDFIIKKSENDDVKISAVLPDQAICDDCLNELNDKTNRRYKYPFINCTNCGPRYSIIENIPYDRKFSSMAKFTMCEKCQKEYDNPLNRRYHAQPISCNECGPTLYNEDLSLKNNEAIKQIATKIKNGEIVAIKGIGGFHLICDALNKSPIRRLREFKSRPHKPFAIMVKDEKQALSHVYMDKYEKKALKSIEKPIVLLEKKENSKIPKDVAPYTNKLGIFIANTPLHVILFDFLPNPIIATSANSKGEPIITKKEDIDEKFGDLLGGILDYDRQILHSCDDSLMQMIDDKSLFLRVSRGIAPLTIMYKSKVKKNILAVGGQEKNAIAFYMDNRIILSPYLGEMGTLKTYELFINTINSWKKFYNIEFDEIICDKHPLYDTTKWAVSQNVKITKVNHHHAHILSTLIDRKIPLNTKILGVAWDGTGYGDDESIWGGEFLICEGKEYERIAYLEPFKLIGGEKSIKNINRIAYSMLLDLDVDLSEFEDIKFLSQLHEKNLNSPKCSSIGRLFDAVCYLVFGLKEVSYDGQSGLLIESFYDEKITDFYPLYLEGKIIKYDKMLLQILKERKNKTQVASKFINSLVQIIIEISSTQNLPTILSGGVFQNKTLIKALLKKAKSNTLHFPQTISPNDGSICVGQLAFGLI